MRSGKTLDCRTWTLVLGYIKYIIGDGVPTEVMTHESSPIILQMLISLNTIGYNISNYIIYKYTIVPSNVWLLPII